MFQQAPLCPATGAFHGFNLVVIGVNQRGEFIEGEDDIGTQLMLDLQMDG